jgi:hypothetical protein
MIMQTCVETSLEKLLRTVAAQGYEGYDPYDAMSSPLLARVARSWPSGNRLWIQALRLSPVNLRRALRIQPALDAKALGLLARAYWFLWDHSGETVFRERGIECLRLLENIAVSGFAGACWAHPFAFVSSRGFLPPNFPTLVSSFYAAQAFLDGYERYGEQRWLDIARSTCDFVLTDLPRIGGSERFCFSYYPGVKLAVHNANLLAAVLLRRVARLTGEDSLIEPAQAALRYTLNDQQPDGSWLYDGPESPSRSRTFVDGFHTGFVLESLWSISQDTGIDLSAPVERGLRFYMSKLISGNGRPLRMLGRAWPLDLRDCAQAIITLMRLREIEPQAAASGQQVTQWTINNMQAAQGYFYYLRCGRWPVPIIYIRFQAWMLVALATYLRIHDSTRRSVARPSDV